MKERPIIFNSEMVKAILENRKTQTRRPVVRLPELKDDPFCAWLENADLGILILGGKV